MLLQTAGINKMSRKRGKPWRDGGKLSQTVRIVKESKAC